MGAAFLAYENESDSIQIKEMTVENRLDRISIFGSLDLTKDKVGLENAMKLKRIVDAAVDALKRDRNLPDLAAIKPTCTDKNLFSD